MPVLRSAKRPASKVAAAKIAQQSGGKKSGAKKSGAKSFKYNRDVRLSAKRAAAVDKNCECKVGNKTFKPFQLGSRTQVKRGTKKALVPADWLAGGARKSPKRSGARKSPKRRSGARKSPKRRSGARKSGARK